ncbi:MAG: cupredoxin domain-containing protein [Thermoleophilia bacterium]|nr:cupredoxin domain-containing protein [Thermoleophilia bacterium]
MAALGAGALSAGTLAAPVLAAPTTAASSAGTAGAATSALSGKKQAAKKKALRKCRSKHSLKRRKACRRSVSRKFAPKPVKPDPPVPPADPVAVIDVRDDYFSPDVVNIQSGDSIKWVWYKINHDPHNVTLSTGPAGVDRLDFQTSSSPAEGYTFTRTFTVPGTYNFMCSLHHNMTMTVGVS